MNAWFHVFDIEKYRQKYRHLRKCPPVARSPHAGSDKGLIVFKQGLFSAREELRGVVKFGNPDFYPPPSFPLS